MRRRGKNAGSRRNTRGIKGRSRAGKAGNRLAAGLLLLALGLTACGQKEPSERPLQMLDDKYRTYYEIFVYSFYDSDGDGIGDLQGVIEKLDYLNDGDDETDTDLGISGIWLMPVMPSATYHKYDTTDYLQIDREYGSLEDFDRLIEECHKRGIRVILDLAMNHSSDRHSWFQRAADYLKSLPEGQEPDAAECPYVEYYSFSKEQESGYEPLADSSWYYEARFWGGMPDLNLKSQAVRREFEQIADFWLDRGVDGFRLDAVKEYVTGSASDNVEILSWFNGYVKEKHPEAYLVCECWTDQNTYASYYESGVDSLFDFEFADKAGVIANVVSGRSPASFYGKALEAEQELYASYREDYINAPFYTNHDMGRGAGYYAGENSPAQTKMANALNLLMNGNAFLYYGEELGMKGAGKDENKRGPMYWSKNPEAEGMCRGPADMEPVKMKFESLEEQSQASDSIYRYVKQAIRLRNQNPEIARGKTRFWGEASDSRICVISREYQGNELLLLLNISPEAAEASLKGISLQTPEGKKEASELSVLGELLSGTEEIQFQGESLQLPPYSVLVMGMP